MHLMYWLANGFHGSRAGIRFPALAIGERYPITPRVWRRAQAELCGMPDCRCTSSPASDPRPDQPAGCPGYMLISGNGHAAAYIIRMEDYDGIS